MSKSADAISQLQSFQKTAIQYLLESDEHDAERIGIQFSAERSAAFDLVLSGLFEENANKTDSIAIVAVGGYGRGHVGIHSDIDIRVLYDQHHSDLETFTTTFLYPLWDCGFQVGHQVLSIDEFVDVARTDLPSATSLLDVRWIAGSKAVVEALRQKAWQSVFAHSELAALMNRLRNEVHARHERFGGSVYLLEPDVKSGAGGLRDLDIVGWAGKARYGVTRLEELVRVGALLAREHSDIRRAEMALWAVRNLLHARARRRNDRLLFDEQEWIAPRLGFGSGPTAVEAMMSDYYRHARTILRTMDLLLGRWAPAKTSRKKPHDEILGKGLRLFDGAVTTIDPEVIANHPESALRIYTVAVKHGLPVLAYARNMIVRCCADELWCETLRKSKEASELFIDLVCFSSDVHFDGRTLLQEIHDVGLVLAMVPEFAPVVGRVHHDVYHGYTVDVHSVAAADRLNALIRGELSDEFALASQIAAELARPKIIHFATLLHDVGKAIGGTEHSERGAVMAAPILDRLGFSKTEKEDVCGLIRAHLTMYHVATRRDVDDVNTIVEFLRHVEGRENLRELYVLTVADLSTTSPTSMTSWKARMLDALFLSAERRLLGDANSHRGQDAMVQELVDIVPHEAEIELRQYISSMPERYLLSNSPHSIMQHYDAVSRCNPNDVSVVYIQSEHQDTAELCVVAPDRSGLLASIAAAIAASRLEVQAAQIHCRETTAGLQAVDLFWVRDRAGGIDGVDRAIPRIKNHLCALLSGQTQPLELVQAVQSNLRERKVPSVATKIVVNDEASTTHTIIEVLTRDKIALLFTIADALYRLHLNISVAKINTEGSRAIDVFYVTESDGTKVTSLERKQEIRSVLSDVLEIKE